MKAITQREIDSIMQTKGEVRGAVFQTDSQYVLEKKGREGLKQVEEETKKMGHPIDYGSIKSLGWYPAGLRAISLIAIARIFNWGEKEIFDMGNLAPKFSIIVKMLLKYFVSLKKSVSQIPIYWGKHWTAGKISNPELHEDKKWIVIRIEGIKLHPIFCAYEAGYFLRIAQYVIKSPKITIKETKCMHRGDSSHDFLFQWE